MARPDAAKEGFRRTGAELKGLGIATQGNLRMETFRAYPEAEYRKIIATLP